MKISKLFILIGFALLTLGGGCKQGGKLAKQGASRGSNSLRKWFRYEVGQAKNYSYGSSQIRPGVTIVGYEPSWLIYDSLYQNYHFEYLTDLVIGEYDMNPVTGFARFDSATFSYHVEEIVQTAHANNTNINVLMALTNYGDFGDEGDKERFLTENAVKTVIKNVDDILTSISDSMGNSRREKVGVLLDFQNIPQRDWKNYPKFIQRLKMALHKPEQDKLALIYLVAPLFPTEEDWYRDSTVFKRAASMADKLILRAHSFGNFPSQEGPMAPLYADTTQGWDFGVDEALSQYIDTLGIPKEKVVLEFPYYGVNFYDSTRLSHHAPLMSTGQMLLMAADTPRVYSDSAGAFLSMGDSTFVLEDTTSLDWKYGYANKRGIAGIGVYGIGYAYGFNPLYEDKLWEIIGNNFGERPPRLFFPGIAFLEFFFVVGLFWAAIREWKVRFALRRRRGRLWFYILIVTLLALSITLCLFPLEKVSFFWKMLGVIAVVIVVLGMKIGKLIFKMGSK